MNKIRCYQLCKTLVQFGAVRSGRQMEQRVQDGLNALVPAWNGPKGIQMTQSSTGND
jgi:hypothetical protein